MDWLQCSKCKCWRALPKWAYPVDDISSNELISRMKLASEFECSMEKRVNLRCEHRELTEKEYDGMEAFYQPPNAKNDENAKTVPWTAEQENLLLSVKSLNPQVTFEAVNSRYGEELGNRSTRALEDKYSKLKTGSKTTVRPEPRGNRVQVVGEGKKRRGSEKRSDELLVAVVSWSLHYRPTQFH